MVNFEHVNADWDKSFLTVAYQSSEILNNDVIFWRIAWGPNNHLTLIYVQKSLLIPAIFEKKKASSYEYTHIFYFYANSAPSG